MAEDAGREATGEMGQDGHAGQVTLLDAVHHADVGAQETGHAPPGGWLSSSD